MAKICRWLSKLPAAVTTTLRYYFVFCKAAIFISVLVFGHSIVEHAVLAVLMFYLADSWDYKNLRVAAIIVNLQNGLSSVLTLLLSHVADACNARLRIILLSAAANFVGVMFLGFLNPADNMGILIAVLVLLSFGKAARITLKGFISDQLKANYPSLGEKQVEACTKIWWRIPYILGAIVVTFVLDQFDWDMELRISAVVIFLAFALFWSGVRCYSPEEPTESPITLITRIFLAAISKRGLSYPNEPSDYHQTERDLSPFEPEILCFRWLDKAAIVKKSFPQEEHENKWKVCTVREVKDVKLLLQMAPMWATFLGYCLVNATGSTFFFEQTSNMNDRIGSNFRVPIVSFYLIQKLSSYAVSYLYELVIPRGWSNAKKLHAMKMKIGIGMVCSCLCCITARLVETHRLHLVREEGYEDDEDIFINMTIFWLTPQFFLLGLMEGLTEDGLEDFFYSQVADSINRFGPPFNEFVLGIGEFLCVLWVLTFRWWIGDTINYSHLDNYYGILAILSLGNLFIYCYVAQYVYKEEDTST